MEAWIFHGRGGDERLRGLRTEVLRHRPIESRCPRDQIPRRGLVRPVGRLHDLGHVGRVLDRVRLQVRVNRRGCRDDQHAVGCGTLWENAGHGR